MVDPESSQFGRKATSLSRTILGLTTAYKCLDFIENTDLKRSLCGHVLVAAGTALTASELYKLLNGDLRLLIGGSSLGLAVASSLIYRGFHEHAAKILAAAAFVTLGNSIGRRWLDNRKFIAPPDEEFQEVGFVTQINFYPVKCCKCVKLEEAECQRYGLALGRFRDREFAVIKDGEVRSCALMREPMLCLIETSLAEKSLILTAPKMETLIIDLTELESDENAEKKHFKVWLNDECGTVLSDKASHWISAYMNEPGYHIVHYGSVRSRNKSFFASDWFDLYKKSDKTLYSYLTPYHLINEASLQELNERLDKPVDVDQFRANIVISGPAAFVEDKWRFIKIGDQAVFRNIRPHTRCTIVNVNPSTGELEQDEPLKTLKAFRQHEDPAYNKMESYCPRFGIGLGIDKFGPIRVGDLVRVTTLKGNRTTNNECRCV